MNKREEKNITEFFQDQFASDKLDGQGWNNPPDSIFSEALNEIALQNNKKKDRKKVFFVLSSILLLVFTFGSFFIVKLTKLEKQLDVITTEQPSAPNNFVNSKPLSQKNIPTDTKQILSAPVVSKSKIVTAPSVSSVSSSSRQLEFKNLKRAQNSATPTKNKSANIKDDSLEKKSKANNLFAEERGLKRKPIQFKTAALLNPQLKIENLESRSLFDKQIELAQLENPQLEKDNYAQNTLSLLIRSNATSLKMLGQLDSNQKLTEYDRLYFGYGLEFAYEIPLARKISLIPSFSFNKLNNETESEFYLNYIKSLETPMNQSEAEYSMDYNMNTPVVDLENSMNFMVDPSLTENGDLIKANSRIRHSLSVINSSAALRYYFIKNSKISLSSDLPLGLNYVTHFESKVLSAYSMNSSVLGQEEKYMSDKHQLKNFYGTIGISTQFQYNLSNKLNLNFGFGYSHSLNSIRNNPLVDSKTYLVNWSSKIGVTKQF